MSSSLVLSPMFQPQWITGPVTVVAGVVTAQSSNPLVFAPTGVTAVPAGVSYLIQRMQVTNTTGTPITLVIWRIPSGGIVGANSNIVVPGIVIPANSYTYPYFIPKALQGIVLQPGDSLYAGTSTANTLTISGDGALIS